MTNLVNRQKERVKKKSITKKQNKKEQAKERGSSTKRNPSMHIHLVFNSVSRKGGKYRYDKAKKCVHCGTILIQEEKKKCAECGAELEEESTECPNCGCPVDEVNALDEPEKPQKVEVTGVKVAKRVKIIIGIVAAHWIYRYNLYTQLRRGA